MLSATSMPRKPHANGRPQVASASESAIVIRRASSTFRVRGARAMARVSNGDVRRASAPLACAARIAHPTRSAAAVASVLHHRRGTMSPEFIFTMKDLRKVVPPNREILKGIWLSFFFGAKIGVLGLNGAGKSSLLRIMAGQDQDYIGEAFLGRNCSVGMLEQEPKLDPDKTVLGNVQDGV